MATSVSGVSNIDVNSIVSQLMTVERQPIDALDKKTTALQTKVSAYGALKGALSVFQGTMASLQSAAKFTSNVVGSSDTAVATASASTSASVGTYDIDVTKLATSQVLQGAGVVSDTAVSASTGTIGIQVGSGAIVNVTIDSSNNTLQGVRDAINAANAGVQASIVNDGTAYRLVLTGDKSGTANTISVTNGLGAGELKDALDGMTEARPAANAELKVNGVFVSSDSNSISSAISGVSLTVSKAGTTKVVVSRDAGQAQAAVQSFAKAYNDLQSTVTSLTKYDAATKKAGVLNGDSGMTSFMSSIRSMMGEALKGTTGQYKQLSDIGVSFQKDGTLAVDSTKLGDALKNSAKDVAALFGRQGTSSNALVSYVGATSATTSGDWGVDVTSAATRAVATAANPAAGSTVIDATNDTLMLDIDGTATGTLKLAQGTYTPAQLATLVQNTINGSSALSGKNISVAVTVDGSGKLNVESQAYGSTSKVANVMGTSLMALGFDGSESGAGVDVAGTFTLAGTSYTATGSAQMLNGPTGTPAEGLALKYTGTAAQVSAGTDGVVTLTEGLAVRLGRFAEQALGSKGVLSTRTDGLAAQMKDIDSRKEALEVRMERIEKQLRAQYVALDSLMTRMNSTSSFLTQQLASLPSSSKS
ncbi:MAG TPA: flagellar filament capping protein FliD [Burkholderiales bacterium]|nr:flagellar filament capping protein FliD [Burkholderiales bacterium]